MTPTQTFDPRDSWDRARRIEVFRYAKEKGVALDESMPKDLMVLRLKAMGLPAPSVPVRSIGALVDARSGDTSPNSHHYDGKPQQATETVVIDAATALERDWKQQQAQKPVAEMNITEVRKELKRLGIPMARTDNMATLKAKLDGKQNAA